jgi:hypothetical protein
MTSKEIYDNLIIRIKESVRGKERVVYDPETGIQKTFLDGKLIHVKQFTPNHKRI